jgi:sterol desaturase/sphingolipid hydroxylase (fatty acid hydroxylase superfamily)
MYLGLNGFFWMCDKYQYLQEYKLYRSEEMMPDDELVQQTLFKAAIGQLFTNPIALVPVYHVFKYFGTPEINAPLPDFTTIYLYSFCAEVFNGWGFYWGHRFLHGLEMYKKIHKQHHSYRGTIGFAARYAHPIEDALTGFIPTLTVCVFGGAHFCVFFAWAASRLSDAYQGHSGYCFHDTLLDKIGIVKAECAAYHDFHHTENIGNFGGP